MTDIKRIGNTGVHTVEGTVAGSRAARLSKARELEQAAYEASKSKIKEQNSALIGRIDDKFNSASDSAEHEFRKRTVGLVTADEFRQARLSSVADSVNTQAQNEQKRQDIEDEKKRARSEKRKKMASTLSFDVNDDDSLNTVPKKSKIICSDGATLISETTLEEPSPGHDVTDLLQSRKSRKNPNVDTSFLPDRERDEMIEEEKRRLRQEWLDQQEIVKNEVTACRLGFFN
jgi:protein FAM50